MNAYQRIVTALVLILSLLTSCYADPPLPTPIGRVVWVKGTLKALMSNKEERLLQKMSVIYLHDTLITDAVSEAQVAFTDASLMTFYPNTQLSLDKYQYSMRRNKKGVGSYVANLIEGGFRTITGLIAKNNPIDYQVNTPVATIGVRGTDYAVYVRNKQVYIGWYNGTPCITAKNQPKNSLCLNGSVRYGYVPTADTIPVPLSQQPDVFNEKLNIVAFQMSPFGTTSNGGSNGPISSFCITP